MERGRAWRYGRDSETSDADTTPIASGHGLVRDHCPFWWVREMKPGAPPTTYVWGPWHCPLCRGELEALAAGRGPDELRKLVRDGACKLTDDWPAWL